MRLLFLSNFYPPASRGGYERWCQEVAEDLRQRGHEIIVLTSRSPADPGLADERAWIRRELHLEMPLVSLRNGVEFFTSRKRREAENLQCLTQILEDEDPDAVLVWGMWNLPRSLPALAEARLPGRVIYYMGDYWPMLPTQYAEYWRAPARNWVTRLPKALLKMAADQVLAGEEMPLLQFAHVIFPTRFMCEDFEQRGIPVGESAVIYGAVDLHPYGNGHRAVVDETGSLSLLYAGRLTHEKGVHTAVEAVSKLVHQPDPPTIHLTVVGDGDPDYVDGLRQRIHGDGIERYVTLLGPQPASAMPGIYRNADILLFTSIWDEPFGRVLVEAMAAGVVVVGTATGGAGELLIDEENALRFPPEDAHALAEQIRRLSASPTLRKQLSERGRQMATQQFDIRRMSAEIEAYLQRVVGEK
ncbi:MAG: glycosyltransferase family 4 protein [Caldilineaceae bacterium]|nr:glycosyltransferase family 4 protein [Caldilineaceae bacterium]